MNKTIELTDEQWQALQSGEDVTIKAPQKFDYPIYARSKYDEMVVRFDTLNAGKIVEEGHSTLPVGFYTTDWIDHTSKNRWEILPGYQEEPEKWEPKGVPENCKYWYAPSTESAPVADRNVLTKFDAEAKSNGNMCAEEWQAEEIAERNRANNRISQYVFEHMEEGEKRDKTVVCSVRGWWVSVRSGSPTDVLMSERVAEMLCDDLNSGRVEL